MLTSERVREVLAYDPETGVMTWRIKVGGCKPKLPGEAAGGFRPDGYLSISVDGKRYMAHRLAWFYATGSWPSHYIDHINGDPSDNRLCNLREATQQQNLRNSRPHSSSSSPYKGINFDKRKKAWAAQIRLDGKRAFLGYFESPEEAHEAYKLAADKHFGEFARA